jgi:TPR repeat protein
MNFDLVTSVTQTLSMTELEVCARQQQNIGAVIELARRYETGCDGATLDLVESKNWLERGAQFKKDEDSALAKFLLGQLYLNHSVIHNLMGGEAALNTAEMWFKEARDQGNQRAAQILDDWKLHRPVSHTDPIIAQFSKFMPANS